jgi:hypothetical protein
MHHRLPLVREKSVKEWFPTRGTCRHSILDGLKMTSTYVSSPATRPVPVPALSELCDAAPACLCCCELKTSQLVAAEAWAWNPPQAFPGQSCKGCRTSGMFDSCRRGSSCTRRLQPSWHRSPAVQDVAEQTTATTTATGCALQDRACEIALSEWGTLASLKEHQWILHLFSQCF